MGSKLLFAICAVLFCKVQSQPCGCPPMGPQIMSPPLMATQQVVAPPVVATTIVDNSVSNALANALQLLIVSDLIETKLGPVLANGNALNTLGPILETIQRPCGSALEIISPIQELSPCGTTLEFIQPRGSSIVETIQPNMFGGYTETFAPFYGPSGPIVETLQPNICGGVTETYSPYRSGPIVEKIQPNIFGGVTETISSRYGPQIVEQFIPNPYGYTETIGANFCGVNELNPFYNGVTEFVTSPCGSPSPVITPSFYERVSEIVPPTAQFLPNYYGGVTEIVSPPMAAEVLFPSSIPAQLSCNFGYNLPSNTPCVNVNVETLPFEPCGCNSCSKGYYF
ncbi:uncharacterized protein LOC123715244 [Pieris brassicae]|uniref:Uncharacterized protein n=1 Tax=Pieris brassicae TaxID=7116 RepID=A0A9P0TNV9_PIEBR|nr:uncharacterized protein LOC123715244 [Pieris brassicae]CAH4032644.1 unnamed protein product [Pieris brassicae]